MGSRSTVSQSMKYGLYIVGSWPGTRFGGLLKFCWLLHATSLLLLQCIYLFTHIRSDGLAQLFDCCGFISTYGLLCVKITFLWLNHGALSDILTSMEEDCVEYSVIDTNNLISKAADLSRIATKTVIVIYVGCSTFFSFATLVAPRSDLVNTTISRRLIMNMNLPFNTNISPTYEIVMIMQFVSLITSTYVYSICSALLLMMMVHMGCQVDILCQAIAKIATSKDHKQFQFVARRHQELIAFSERIEKVFTFIAVAQLLSNTVVTCCVGYIIIYTLQEGNDLPQLLKYACSYIAICSEVFTYCYAGEYLNMKVNFVSDMIVDTAYQISWYNLEPSMSRHVILLLLRSQKGLRLTFGKISTLSLQTFSGIMKSSASYMSVFLAKS
ncbi:odorant receptor 82a-like isoform X2 [Megalopta genalis]|uniref:odorant receptor 82a-like isoform X2 n=1 Tax=Megalopta genalis TaxID=115081 RepID=UPI003FD007EC